MTSRRAVEPTWSSLRSRRGNRRALRHRQNRDPRGSAIGLLRHGVLHPAGDGDACLTADFVRDDAAANRVAEIFLRRTRPSFPSNTRRFPLVSPVRTMPPALGVIDATIEVSASYVQTTLPESASTAVTCPRRWPIGSWVPNPFADPRNGMPGSSLRCSGPPSVIVVAQSIAGT